MRPCATLLTLPDHHCPDHHPLPHTSGGRFPAWSLLIFLPLALWGVSGCAGVRPSEGGGTSYESRLTLAAGYIRSADRRNAIDTLSGAVDQEPERPDAYAMLGDVFYSGGYTERAVEEYRRSIEKGEKDPAVWNNLAWLESGLGYHGAALYHIEKAIEMAPVPIYPYLDTRARILGAMGNVEEARKSAAMALRLTPASDPGMRRALEKFLDELKGRGDGG